MTTGEAIRKLRNHLGESQQAFSNRLGLTVRTIARWELEKPPDSSNVLNVLADLAHNAALDDLYRFFRSQAPLSPASRRKATETLRSCLDILTEYEARAPEKRKNPEAILSEITRHIRYSLEWLCNGSSADKTRQRKLDAAG